MSETQDTLILTEAEQLYDAGQMVIAWERLTTHGPIGAWRGAQRLIVARLMYNLGNERGGDTLVWLARREMPDDPKVRYYDIRRLIHRRGPLAAWREMAASPLPDTADPQIRGEWLSLQASLANVFRDFTRGEQLYAQAEEITPRKRWLWVERAMSLRLQDRYDEARASAERALAESDIYRPAIQELAHLYTLAGESDRAVALLAYAAERSQSPAL